MLFLRKNPGYTNRNNIYYYSGFCLPYIAHLKTQKLVLHEVLRRLSDISQSTLTRKVEYENALTYLIGSRVTNVVIILLVLRRSYSVK